MEKMAVKTQPQGHPRPGPNHLSLSKRPQEQTCGPQYKPGRVHRPCRHMRAPQLRMRLEAQSHSAATSSMSEAAAIAPLSDIDIGAEEYVDQEGLIHVACPHTPTNPLLTPQPHTQATLSSPIADPALHSYDLSTTPEASRAIARPAAAPSTSAAPTDFEARLSRVEAGQDSMLELVRQYVADGEDTRREIAQAIAGNTAAINASTVMVRDSLGTVTQVQTAILQHMQLQHMQQQQPAPAVPINTAITPSSTPASSAPSSLVRLTRRSAWQSEMLPPDTKKARK